MLGGSRKQVCGEQVTIEASGAAVTTVASAIAPLLVPDVPVFLWWKDIPHYDDVLFNRMAAMADRIVIDSSCFDQPHSDMQRLARIVGERPQYMSATDLNWGRLTAWRTLIAGFWDVPDYRPYLERIERVTVEYDAPDAAPGEIAPKALLVVGWLASRLGWKLEGAGAHEEGITAGFIFGAGEHRIDVRMSVSEGRASSDGMLDGVTFSSAGPHAEFRVALSADGKRLETDAGIDGVRSVGRVLSYEQKSEGQRLSRELTLPVRDIVYEQALREAARLIEAMK
jgi:glucose-6-phosphate dehydrogenase assembly protein OpcA